MVDDGGMAVTGDGFLLLLGHVFLLRWMTELTDGSGVSAPGLIAGLDDPPNHCWHNHGASNYLIGRKQTDDQMTGLVWLHHLVRGGE